MKLITYCISMVLLFQFYSCASQTDSLKIEPSQENKTQRKSKKEAPRVKKSRKTTNKGASDPEVLIDDANELNTTIQKDKAEQIAEEEGEMDLSVISYQNILNNKFSEVPVQGQKVKLMIKNNHTQAMWYLMPVSGEKEMPIDGKFMVNSKADPPFLAKRYGTDNAALIELIYHGKPNQSFRAFYVEAKSFLLFRNYDLGTYPEGDYVPFWAVRDLDVNNEMTLEDWLPFSVASSPNITIHNTTESGAAKWKNLGEQVVFSSKKVAFIQANKVKKYQIPVGVVR